MELLIVAVIVGYIGWPAIKNWPVVRDVTRSRASTPAPTRSRVSTPATSRPAGTGGGTRNTTRRVAAATRNGVTRTRSAWRNRDLPRTRHHRPAGSPVAPWLEPDPQREPDLTGRHRARPVAPDRPVSQPVVPGARRTVIVADPDTNRPEDVYPDPDEPAPDPAPADPTSPSAPAGTDHPAPTPNGAPPVTTTPTTPAPTAPTPSGGDAVDLGSTRRTLEELVGVGTGLVSTVDSLIGSLQANRLDPKTLAEVAEIMEAADAVKAKAQAALNGLNARHGAIEEAVVASGGAAERTAWYGGS